MDLSAEPGDHDAAMTVALAVAAVARYRRLAAEDPRTYASGLARVLDTLAVAHGAAGHPQASLAAAREACALYTELAARGFNAVALEALNCGNNLAVALSKAGESREALAIATACLEQCRALDARGSNPEVRILLARTLGTLAVVHGDLGDRAHAVSAGLESVDLYRALATGSARPLLLPTLAAALNNLAILLSRARRVAEAIATAHESVAAYRELAAAEGGTCRPQMADALATLAGELFGTGDTAAARENLAEAVAICRDLAGNSRRARLPSLATCLTTMTAVLRDAGCYRDALERGTEALQYWRELVEDDRAAFLPMLAWCLRTLARTLGEAGRPTEGLALAREAVQAARELVETQGTTSHPRLARSLIDLGIQLGAADRGAEAIEAGAEAIRLLRELVAGDRKFFMFDLAVALLNHGENLFGLDRRFEADRAWRECALLVLRTAPVNVVDWTELARRVTRRLVSWSDLRDWYLPLMQQLVEHRELAEDPAQATRFIDLQRRVAAQAWDVLGTLPYPYAELLDEVLTALVSALQSPDLTRWLQARGDYDAGGHEGGVALARIKRDVIETETRLAALQAGLGDADGNVPRARLPGDSTHSQYAAATKDLEGMTARAQSLRQAFRAERARLIAADPRFAAAFQPLDSSALRAASRHANGSALLCLLELDSAPGSTAAGRIVAALVHADDRATRLMELPGLHALARDTVRWRIDEHDAGARSVRRGAPTALQAAGTRDAEPTAFESLGERMGQTFWFPLQEALQRAVAESGRLHICLNGTTQQLPLGMHRVACAGWEIVCWPGLPYLRRAASSCGAAVEDPRAPWLVGQDCAWASEQPLPMAAVEAALLRHLLGAHGRAVQSIGSAAPLRAQLQRDGSALVACCHGGAEQVHFDHALHLGPEPLTVGQILQQPSNPPLALLPACHAGRTDEDAAGNALGVAAAFLLSGTRVVVASSKAVPDSLQPWLSTLMVWHAMQGLAHHEAATLAREQFASLTFPAAYRTWLQQALPEALATIQPGGEEYARAGGASAHAALEAVKRYWPWRGDAQYLFSTDLQRRRAATESLVEGILVPRGGDEETRALAAQARAMAAFVFVYGVDGD